MICRSVQASTARRHFISAVSWIRLDSSTKRHATLDTLVRAVDNLHRRLDPPLCDVCTCRLAQVQKQKPPVLSGKRMISGGFEPPTAAVLRLRSTPELRNHLVGVSSVKIYTHQLVSCPSASRHPYCPAQPGTTSTSSCLVFVRLITFTHRSPTGSQHSGVSARCGYECESDIVSC